MPAAASAAPSVALRPLTPTVTVSVPPCSKAKLPRTARKVPTVRRTLSADSPKTGSAASTVTVLLPVSTSIPPEASQSTCALVPATPPTAPPRLTVTARPVNESTRPSGRPSGSNEGMVPETPRKVGRPRARFVAEARTTPTSTPLAQRPTAPVSAKSVEQFQPSCDAANAPGAPAKTLAEPTPIVVVRTCTVCAVPLTTASTLRVAPFSNEKEPATDTKPSRSTKACAAVRPTIGSLALIWTEPLPVPMVSPAGTVLAPLPLPGKEAAQSIQAVASASPATAPPLLTATSMPRSSSANPSGSPTGRTAAMLAAPARKSGSSAASSSSRTDTKTRPRFAPPT